MITTQRQQDKLNQCDENIFRLHHRKRGRKRMRRINKWNNQYNRIVNQVYKNPLLDGDDLPW